MKSNSSRWKRLTRKSPLEGSGAFGQPRAAMFVHSFHRSLLGGFLMYSDAVQNFWKKVRKTSKCWIWTGARSKTGYGNFWANGKAIRAHRFSYQLFKGKFPSKKYICHTCDNHWCVNPKHLWVGDQYDNMADMQRKRRSCWTLNKRQVKLIRKIYDNRKSYFWGGKSLAIRFGVTPSAVTDIAQRKHQLDVV